MKKERRVCHLTSAHPAKDIRIFYKECISLSNAGFDVTLIGKNDKNEIVEGVRIIKIRKFKSRILRIIFVPWIVLYKALIIRAEIYHFHDPELLIIGLILRLLRKKVIYDVHEDVPRQLFTKSYLNKKSAIVLSKLFEIFENICVRGLSGIIAATPTIKDRFTTINKKSIDVNNFPIISEIDAYDWKIKTENNICYIGGIFKERGIVEIIKSLNDNVNLHLAGKISPVSFEKELRQFPEWKFVKYMGFINRKDINKILKLSKIGIVTLHPFPSYIVSLPIKMFEYMAAGIPVIASNFPLWKKIIEDNNCGICVDPLNIIEIKNAINYLLNNEEQAKQMGINGRDAVLNKFNWNSQKGKLIDFYKSL